MYSAFGLSGYTLPAGNGAVSVKELGMKLLSAVSVTGVEAP